MMRGQRVAHHARALARQSDRPTYICRSCLANSTRQFSQSRSLDADMPWSQRLRETIFGKKSSQEQPSEEKARSSAATTQMAKVKRLSDRKPLRRDGQTYTYADVVDAAGRRDYLPATTWEGLERIGSEKWAKKHNDGGEKYEGFFAPKSQLAASQWQRVLHHTAVEVMALQNAGRNVLNVCNDRDISARLVRKTLAVGLGASGQEVKLHYNDVVAGIPEQGTTASATDVNRADVLKTQLQTISAGSKGEVPTPAGFANFDLSDAQLKLAIVKRVMQLTGKRIPDVVISHSKTLADLWHACKKKEKPKKLFRTPQLLALKKGGTNVAVFEGRRTPIHKEQEIGRWKLIQTELELRDLPITGSRHPGAKRDLRFS